MVWTLQKRIEKMAGLLGCLLERFVVKLWLFFSARWIDYSDGLLGRREAVVDIKPMVR